MEFFKVFWERQEEVYQLFLQHVDLSTMAVLLSLVIGIPVGILITKNRHIASIIIGVANIMQSIPSLALLAFMVPFVGIGEKPAIIMVVLYALLPIIKNTYTGICSIDPKILEAAKGIGLSKCQQLFKVELPMAASFIMAGVRISAVTAVGTVTIAAFAGAGGLGWLINLGLNGNDPYLVLLGAIPASLLALAVDFVLSMLEKVLTPEGLKPADQIILLSKKEKRGKQMIAFAISGVLLIVPIFSIVNTAFEEKVGSIRVGSQNFTESIILGYLYSELITENTDLKVEEKFNLNGSVLTFNALVHGDIDMFTDYTGIVSSTILKHPMESNPQKVYDDVKYALAEQNISVSKPLGFSNEYVISTSPAVAQRYQMSTLSDLIHNAQFLRLGGTTSFIQREDLLPKLKTEYGLYFKSVTGLEGNIRYQAISSGEIDVTDAYSTDAMTVKVELVPLEDDLDFFPPYEAINLCNEDTLNQYPELIPLLEKLEGALDNTTMAKMNYAVDVDGKNPRDVAREFLTSKDLIR